MKRSTETNIPGALIVSNSLHTFVKFFQVIYRPLIDIAVNFSASRRHFDRFQPQDNCLVSVHVFTGVYNTYLRKLDLNRVSFTSLRLVAAGFSGRSHDNARPVLYCVHRA